MEPAIQKLIVRTKSLKQFLSLFEPGLELEQLQLGDTGHPSSGYVDQKILETRARVADVLNFNYDFHSLVLFICRINHMDVELCSEKEENGYEYYSIVGQEKELRKL